MSSLLQTVLLVPNTHCPSCPAAIDSLLSRLRPRPASVATSIVSHTVTVRHDRSLKPRVIVKALDKAGYDVESTDLENFHDAPSRSRRRSNFLGATVRWIRRDAILDDETRKKRHQKHCKLCRTSQSTDESGGSDQTPIQDRSFVVVENPSTQPDNSFRANLSIGGMTCVSCVRTITEILEEIPWVTQVNVALITQSASVEFRGEEGDASQFTAVIDEIGYEATLEDVAKLPKEKETECASGAASDLWRASYSIEGMTCSACIRTVTEAMRSVSWVQSADVSFVNHSATVVFEGKDHLDLVTEAVEDVGYGATVNDVAPISTKSASQSERRSVSIIVGGFYCQHCPGRIDDALNRFNGQVEIEKPATMQDPIVTISYIPSAPELTIRAILAAISSADPEFRPVVYHPPTLEDRARQMHARAQRQILYRVLLSVAVAIPTFIIGIVYMALVPKHDSGRQYLMQTSHGVTRAEWALFAMATPVYFFAADHFHRRTVAELYWMWKPGSTVPITRRFYRFGSMDMLISFGTTIAYVSSIAELIIAAVSHTTEDSSSSNTMYFDSVVFLTMFLLIGRLIEAYSRAKTGDAVATLQNLRPREALLVLPAHEQKSDVGVQSAGVDMIDLTDIVRVVHGASPPWDGVVVSGDTILDESSLTGESKPVPKAVGDTVYSGTINKGGPISIQITRVSGESMLDQIIKVVREGQARRAPIEKVADILTSYFVPVITLVAIATWLIWLSLGESSTLPHVYLDIKVGGWPLWSLQFAIAVFVVACPCGIGLATPTALFVGGGLAAKHGILVKGGGEAFQEASQVDIVVFDKTGTLTQGGDPKVTDCQFLLPSEDTSALDEGQIRAAVIQLEGNSSHPIGKALIDFCTVGTPPNSANVAQAKEIEEVAGKGMKGFLDFVDHAKSVEILVGNEALMVDHGISLDDTTSATLDAWKEQAKSIVIVAASTAAADRATWDPVLILAVSDAVRPESRFVIESLTRQGIDVWMLSGDNTKTARAVGAIVGIREDHIIAGVLPQEKAAKIQYLQRSQVANRSRSFFQGRQGSTQRPIVAMIGDGINDSPALTAADVGIAVGSGSDVAISSADFILINPSLATLLTLLHLSRVVFRRVKFNFAWALVYNVLAIPIAAGCLYAVKTGSGTRVRLDPVWASLAMALSSVSVICSSLVMRSGVPGIGFRAAKVDMTAQED